MVVHGVGHVSTLNVNTDEVWAYRFRAQKGHPPPQLQDDDDNADGGENEDEDLELQTEELPADTPKSQAGESPKSKAGTEDGEERLGVKGEGGEEKPVRV